MAKKSTTAVPEAATREGLAKFANRRRLMDYEIPGVGRLVLGSLNAGQYARIDAARSRAALAGHRGDEDAQIEALNDGTVEMLAAMALTPGDLNPFFLLPDDREFILSLDSSIVDPLVDACIRHAGLDAANVQQLAKN